MFKDKFFDKMKYSNFKALDIIPSVIIESKAKKIRDYLFMNNIDIGNNNKNCKKLLKLKIKINKSISKINNSLKENKVVKEKNWVSLCLLIDKVNKLKSV